MRQLDSFSLLQLREKTLVNFSMLCQHGFETNAKRTTKALNLLNCWPSVSEWHSKNTSEERFTCNL